MAKSSSSSNALRKSDSGTDIQDDIAYAREILAHEAQAINEVSKLLDSNFENAVQVITELPPGARLVVTGMGKAGFIAQKISATFASTGIPSFYIHPADAVHGDLGRFQKKDLLLVLSNSGETTEILRILPQVKRIGCPVISITAEENSNLAKHSDLNLFVGRHLEAGPLGLAPTTSTTAMLAIGDALAMAVLRRLGLSREQFALYHPGGNLGRTLMLVSEIMRQDDEHCIVPETMLTKDVLHQISVTRGRPGAATIVDSAGLLAGIFTDGNLRRCLESGSDFLLKPICEVMTRNPKVVAPHLLATEALQVLSEHKIDQVIVVDERRIPLGLIDIQDLIDFREATRS